MDLSGLKWPVIILVIVAVGWLMSSGGVNWMVNNFTKATPGQDVERDKLDEAGLSRVSKYLVLIFRYEKASQVLETALDRYPNGPNYWNNLSRLSTCYDKMRRYQDAYNIIQELMANDAHSKDPRVPVNESLRLRADKLKEVHELR